MALGHCPASAVGIESARRPLALHSLSTSGRFDGGDAPAVLLDRGYPWPSATEEFRAHIFLPVPLDGLLLWGFASGAERPTVLLNDSTRACDLFLDSVVPGVMVFTNLVAALAP